MATKKQDRRIEQAYYKVANGIQINMMDIPKVFAVGRQALAEGADDEALEQAISSFVQKIRLN